MSPPAAFGLFALVFAVGFFLVRVPFPRYLENRLAALATQKKTDPLQVLCDGIFGVFAASIAFGAIEWVGRLLNAASQWRWLIVILVWLSLVFAWCSVRNAIPAVIRKASETAQPMDPK